MGEINMSRVVLGGLLAGLVINVGESVLNMYVLDRLWSEAMQALNRPAFDSGTVVFFVLMSFALGLLAVWVYAAIRPRFGAGPLTAVCAGLVVWALAVLYPTGAGLPMHLFPQRLLFYSTAWAFFELPVATIAGAWIYREAE